MKDPEGISGMCNQHKHNGLHIGIIREDRIILQSYIS